MEDLRALRSGICSRKEEEKCCNEFGDNLDWACANCGKKKSAEDLDISPYTIKMLRVRLLRLGGYPFKRNDLTPEEWEDQGKIEQWLLTPEQ
jgi:hypothetical protein